MMFVVPADISERAQVSSWYLAVNAERSRNQYLKPF